MIRHSKIWLRLYYNDSVMIKFYYAFLTKITRVSSLLIEWDCALLICTLSRIDSFLIYWDYALLICTLSRISSFLIYWDYALLVCTSSSLPNWPLLGRDIPSQAASRDVLSLCTMLTPFHLLVGFACASPALSLRPGCGRAFHIHMSRDMAGLLPILFLFLKKL